MVDRRLVDLTIAALQGDARIACPSAAVARSLARAGTPVQLAPLPTADRSQPDFDGVVLIDGELSAAGDQAEGLLAAATAALRPGGLLVAAVDGALWARARRLADDRRRWTAEELQRALGHFGFALELVCAPGAAALLAGEPAGPLDVDLDRRPGLLDAGPTIVAVGRLGAATAARTANFFVTLPRKVVAAAVLCRDSAGRLLLVHDAFKRHWTIPGGVVDPGEDPRTGAVREAWEEAGIGVRAGAVLGVFAAAWPDRIVLVYEAWPARDGAGARPAPLHAHEIDAVEWVALPEALERLASHVADQVRRCLDSPGGTWWQGLSA